jgi:hypothetical protein
MQMRNSTPPDTPLRLLWLLLLFFPSTPLKLAAQSGILMNNGAMITPTPTQASVFADSSSTRAAMMNGAISTSNVLVLAAWPCTALGGIVYAGTVHSGFGTETCLGLGSQGKVLQVGGSSAAVAVRVAPMQPQIETAHGPH